MFDGEKYQHLDPTAGHCIDGDPDIHSAVDSIRALVGLRIDDKGGIYLQPPLLDANYAYFK